MTYKEQLLDPRWQKKRLEILKEDDFTCQLCGDKKTTLHIHHFVYRKGRMAWEYDAGDLMTVCADCHYFLHNRKLFNHKELELIDFLMSITNYPIKLNKLPKPMLIGIIEYDKKMVRKKIKQLING